MQRSGITLGIDPGTARLGYGVIAGGRTPRLIDAGLIETWPDEPMSARLVTLYDGMVELLHEFRPDAVAIEQLFFARNVTTAISVGQARGVVLLAAAQANVPLAEYTPSEVKHAIAGYGKADKAQMQELVRIILDLSAVPQPDDAADALAIAICHNQTIPFSERGAHSS